MKHHQRRSYSSLMGYDQPGSPTAVDGEARAPLNENIYKFRSPAHKLTTRQRVLQDVGQFISSNRSNVGKVLRSRNNSVGVAPDVPYPDVQFPMIGNAAMGPVNPQHQDLIQTV